VEIENHVSYCLYVTLNRHNMATSTAVVNNAFITDDEPLTFTENGYDGTGEKCLDFFTEVMARDKNTAMSNATIEKYMTEAWTECPSLTLRLVANLRDIRGETGKGERHASEVCWKWLLKTHPKQVSANMVHIPFFGRWKDLLDICLDTELETQMLELYTDQLSCDLVRYQKGFASDDPLERTEVYGTVSLAAKWAPTENCAYDKAAKKAGRPTPSFRLATMLYDQALGDTLPGNELEGTSLMRWYRKTYLTPLRNVVGIVESYLCQQKFDTIDFGKVPGVAMEMYSKNTFPSDKRPELAARYAQWQKARKVKMNSGTVDPYEIVDLIPTPLDIMHKALSDKRYNRLTVVE
jgi:hypothetical protein